MSGRPYVILVDEESGIAGAAHEEGAVSITIEGADVIAEDGLSKHAGKVRLRLVPVAALNLISQAHIALNAAMDANWAEHVRRQAQIAEAAAAAHEACECVGRHLDTCEAGWEPGSRVLGYSL